MCRRSLFIPKKNVIVKNNVILHLRNCHARKRQDFGFSVYMFVSSVIFRIAPIYINNIQQYAFIDFC